jgi:hypothetical protein
MLYGKKSSDESRYGRFYKKLGFSPFHIQKLCNTKKKVGCNPHSKVVNPVAMKILEAELNSTTTTK